MTDTANSYNSLLKSQQVKALELRTSKAKERIKKLKSIKSWIEDNEEIICDALYSDFKKSRHETYLSEIMPMYGEIRYIIKNLKNWMYPKSVSVPLFFTGTSNIRIPQPKGNALIISPWNYPFLLTMKPVLSAIAAGCTVIIKPSELTENTSELIKKMMHELFTEDEITVITGGADTAIELQKLPFNHVFFTGSPKVGKLVMIAAAKNLASVTLELGGKSPTIVDETANLKEAAIKIAYGKFLNAGQTCIAPDYLFVHTKVKDKLLEEIQSYLKKLNDDPENYSKDYCRIINKGHFSRIVGLIKEAESEGAQVITGGHSRETDAFLEPTLLTQITPEMRIMKEEIFGPLLPVLEYTNLQEVTSFINKNEKPLALYIYSKNRGNQDFITKETSSGSVVINDFAIQFIYHGIPFGGINNSGTGYSGGEEGFKEFSHLKPVIKNHFSPSPLFYPPYTKFVKKLTRFAAKYLA